MRRLEGLGLCLLGAVVWAWPLPIRLNAVLRDPFDGQTQAWVIAWVRHALRTDPASLFQANAFAPARDVLAFSEPLIGYGALGLPLGVFPLNAAGVLNVLCILVLGLSAWSVAFLAEELGAGRSAALVGALAACFGALTTVQLGFVSFTAFGGIAWMVLFARRLLVGGTWKDAIGLGLATAIQGWFSLHFLAFGLATLLVTGLCFLVRDLRRTLAAVPRLAGGAALAAFLLVPLVIPLLRVRRSEGFSRAKVEVLEFSALPGHFVTTTGNNPGQRFLPGRSGAETALYPGTMALALAITGLGLGRRTPSLAALRVTGALVALTGAVGALGVHAPFWPLLTWLAPPLFGGIRVAARFAFVLQIGLALLAASGVAGLVSLVTTRRARAVALGGVLFLIFLDVRQVHPFGFHPETAPSPTDEFLARTKTGGPILHLPLTFEPEEAGNLFASIHTGFKPIVNGTLSYVPDRHVALAARLRAPRLVMSLLDDIARWPVGTIVVHDHSFSTVNRAAVLEFVANGRSAGKLTGPRRFPHLGGTDWVFGVVAGEASALAFDPSGPDATAFESEVAALRSGPSGSAGSTASAAAATLLPAAERVSRESADPVHSWILPSSARAPGPRGAFYTTDLTVANTGTRSARFTLKFLGHDTDGRSGPEKTYALPAEKSATYADVHSTVFGIELGYGAFQLVADSPLVTVTELLIVRTPGGGDVGQNLPVFGAPDLIGAGASRSIPGVHEDGAYRTNLVLANATPFSLDVDVILFSEAGAALGRKRCALPPLGMTQLSRVARSLGVGGDVSGARLVLSTPAPGGAFAAYALVIDALTNTPRILVPR